MTMTQTAWALRIAMDQEYAGTGTARRLEDGSYRIEDCAAVLPDGAYETIEHDLRSGHSYGAVTHDGHRYEWWLD